MDNGASSYRRFLEGDDNGIVEIIKDYKDGLNLFLNQYVNNIYVAEELAEDTFLGSSQKSHGSQQNTRSKHGYALLICLCNDMHSDCSLAVGHLVLVEDLLVVCMQP